MDTDDTRPAGSSELSGWRQWREWNEEDEADQRPAWVRAEAAWGAEPPQVRTGLRIELSIEAGKRLSLWHPLEQINGKLRRLAARILARRGHPDMDEWVVAEIVGFVEWERIRGCWLPYRSHRLLGRPYRCWRWPERYPKENVEHTLEEIAQMKTRFAESQSRGAATKRAYREVARAHVLQLHDMGLNPYEIEREVSIARSTIRRWIRQA